MKTLSIGLVGLGRHGARYARHLREGIPGLALAAVCRRDRAAGEALAREAGARFHADARALAADPAVGAVIVVTPHDRHAEAAVAALALGKPVLVEKPLAGRLEDGEAIARAAGRAPGAPVAMVAQTLRYEPGVRAFRDALADMGGPLALHVLLRGEDRNAGADGRWREDGNDGGALLDAGVHFFDLVTHLGLGRVARLWARTARHLGYPVEDAFTAVLETERCAVTVDVTRVGGSRWEMIEALTPSGVLVLDRFAETLTRIVGRERTPIPFERGVPTLPIALAAFRDAVLGRAPSPVPIADGLRALRVAEACRASARRGAWVDVASSEPR
jgi:predicted dehydrogenase